MTLRTIEFRGRQVVEGWPEQLAASQLETTVVKNGVEHPRVRYGEERDDWGADRSPCHDCAAVKGEYHGPGCDVERCPICDGQAMGCDCDDPDEDAD